MGKIKANLMNVSFSRFSCLPFRVFRELIFLLIFIIALSGCSVFRPTLHAAFVEEVPLPKSLIETQIWQKAKPLKVALAQFGGRATTAEIRAVHDGRAISFLVAWPDQTETVIAKAWVRMKPGAPWKLQTVLNDRLWLMFPLTAKASFDIYRGPAGRYDVWQWQGAWSNISGYADDGRLIVKTYPGPEPPKDAEGVVYPNPSGKGCVEQLWRNDDGRLGTIADSEPPAMQTKSVIPAGIANPYADGSVIDVRAIGSYSRQDIQSTTTFWTKRGQRVPGYWFGDKPPEDRPGSYFVKYYRLLKTKSDEEDYQFNGRGPHPFALAIVDDAAGAQPFMSRPLQLTLDKAPI